jgi:enterochelin esterase-like enzyme
VIRFRRLIPLMLIALAQPLLGAAPTPVENHYKLGPDSVKRHEGVPTGKVEKFSLTSQIYPGTMRDVWVYIPTQYDGSKPACLMVFQDGQGCISEKGEWRVPIVFDNLIAKKDMPVTVGVFINPGNDPVKNPPATTKPAPGTKPRQKFSDRSIEYDTVSDKYSKFLLEEVLPEVKKRYDLKITDNPEGRAIAGGSSGGICAFSVAWFRPDSFHKVFSYVGSFTNIRHGDQYPELVRKSEKKPIRIYMQDGTHDLQNQFGKWFEANTAMAAALKEKGYDVVFTVGDGGHNSWHAASIFPDVLRWMWRDYPKE